jgi:hypothetical protein
LNHICLNATEAELRALAGFNNEIDDYVADFRDASRDPAGLLYTAFAYVDEFTYADAERVLDAGYQAYSRLRERLVEHSDSVPTSCGDEPTPAADQ